MQRRRVRFLRVGFTQRRPTLRPRALRANVSVTRAFSERRKEIVVPTAALREQKPPAGAGRAAKCGVTGPPGRSSRRSHPCRWRRRRPDPATFTVIVAGFESEFPSLPVNVNESVPEKLALGV